MTPSNLPTAPSASTAPEKTVTPGVAEVGGQGHKGEGIRGRALQLLRTYDLYRATGEYSEYSDWVKGLTYQDSTALVDALVWRRGRTGR